MGVKKLLRPVVDHLEKLGFDFGESADGIAGADNNLFPLIESGEHQSDRKMCNTDCGSSAPSGEDRSQGYAVGQAKTGLSFLRQIKETEHLAELSQSRD